MPALNFTAVAQPYGLGPFVVDPPEVIACWSGGFAPALVNTEGGPLLTGSPGLRPGSRPSPQGSPPIRGSKDLACLWAAARPAAMASDLQKHRQGDPSGRASHGASPHAQRPTPQGPPERSWRQMIRPVSGPFGPATTASDQQRTIAGGPRRGGLRLPAPFGPKGEGQPQQHTGDPAQTTAQTTRQARVGEIARGDRGNAKGREGPDFHSEFPDAEPTSKPRPKARDRSRAKLGPPCRLITKVYFIGSGPVQRWPPKTAAIPAKAGQTFDRAGPMKGVR